MVVFVGFGMVVFVGFGMVVFVGFGIAVSVQWRVYMLMSPCSFAIGSTLHDFPSNSLVLFVGCW
jgi:hypothetical protein